MAGIAKTLLGPILWLTLLLLVASAQSRGASMEIPPTLSTGEPMAIGSCLALD